MEGCAQMSGYSVKLEGVGRIEVARGGSRWLEVGQELIEGSGKQSKSLQCSAL